MMIGFIILFSPGCSNIDISKSTQGAVGGAVAGAAIGAQAGGARGALVGAVIGGIIGQQIGNYLDEQDKKKMLELEQRALRTGKSQSFVSNKTKEKVSITTGPTTKETLATYSLSPNVINYSLSMSPTVDISAYVDTPIYSSTNGKIRPRLVMKKGEKLTVPARVATNTHWGAVVEGETVIGYVPTSYLDKKTAKSYAPPVSAKTTKDSDPISNPVVNAKTRPSDPAITTAATTAQPQLQKASVVGNCKISVRRVKDTTENMKWCEEPPSGWKQVKA